MPERTHMALPANVDTGLVTGRFIVGVIDGPDLDDEPNAVPAQGTVSFTASVPYLPNPTANPAPVTILKAPIIGVLDSDGYLCVRNIDGSAGQRGLRLVATDDPDLSVQGWTWNVTYTFESVNGIRPQIQSHSMALPSGASVDLTSVVKVPSSQGIGTEQAEALVASAQAAAALAAEAAQATDAGVATLLTSGEQTAPILAAKVDRGALYVEASDYGAVGDGVTDDTAALQAWLDAPGPVRRLHDGTYRITAGLTSAEPGRQIVCDGATILADAPEATALTVAGDDSHVRVTIDGANTAAWGVHATGARIEIGFSDISRLRSETGAANGIRVTNGGGSHVHHNRISDVHAVGNATGGDANGASRAIVITGDGDATGNHLVDANIIEQITGEEGDAIHVSLSGGAYARTRVTGNIIRDVSRRAVKVQASGVHVGGNVYEHHGPPPSNGTALIDVQYVHDCEVVANTLDASLFPMGVQVTGTPESRCLRTSVNRNTITGTDDTAYGITAMRCADFSATGNLVRGTVGPVRLSGVSGALVEGNTIRGGAAGFNVGIKIVADCTDVIARGNIGFDGPRNMLIENDSPAAVVESNHARFATTGQVVRGLANAVRSVYRANTSSGPGAATFGAFTDQTVSMVASLNAGGTAGVSADVFWTTGDPTTTLPGRVSSRGDIAYNRTPTAGGVAGWICVTAGTPGTWKALGTIAA